jgi:hypothetical protein
MAQLFSEEWMRRFQQEWNNESELSDALGEIDFSSVIAYGFDDEDNPRGVLVIEKGKAVKGGSFKGEALKWDLRASQENWEKWMKDGIGMMKLGMAYTTGKLKFKVGDYTAMIKNPKMAGPFIKSFDVMGRV